MGIDRGWMIGFRDFSNSNSDAWGMFVEFGSIWKDFRGLVKLKSKKSCILGR